MNIEGLSLDQMRAAVSVAQTGSFSAAARQLGRTQSALSYAVAALEGQLGMRLFDRSDGQRPQPTDAGRLLLREIEAVVHQANALKQRAKAVMAGLESEVSLILDAHYPVEALTPLLREFQAAYPTVQVRLTIEAMSAVPKAVLDGAAIIGIMASAPELPLGLIADALPPISRIPVISAQHVLAAGATENKPLPHMAALDIVQVVLSNRGEASTARDYLVHSARTWRVTDLGCKRLLLLAGLGWGYMPQHMVEGDIAKRRLRHFHVEGLRDRNKVAVLVVRRRDGVLGPASSWLLQRILK